MHKRVVALSLRGVGQLFRRDPVRPL